MVTRGSDFMVQHVHDKYINEKEEKHKSMFERTEY